MNSLAINQRNTSINSEVEKKPVAKDEKSVKVSKVVAQYFAEIGKYAGVGFAFIGGVVGMMAAPFIPVLAPLSMFCLSLSIFFAKGALAIITSPLALTPFGLLAFIPLALSLISYLPITLVGAAGGSLPGLCFAALCHQLRDPKYVINLG